MYFFEGSSNGLDSGGWSFTRFPLECWLHREFCQLVQSAWRNPWTPDHCVLIVVFAAHSLIDILYAHVWKSSSEILTCVWHSSLQALRFYLLWHFRSAVVEFSAVYKHCSVWQAGGSSAVHSIRARALLGTGNMRVFVVGKTFFLYRVIKVFSHRISRKCWFLYFCSLNIKIITFWDMDRYLHMYVFHMHYKRLQ